MNIDRLTIVLRPRPPFEGLDLGFAAASRWFLTLWLLWMATAVPVFLLINSLCFSRPWIALLIVWWVKPLFETPLLYWLSRRIFNEAPDCKTVLRAIPGILRPRLLSRLTLRRLSPARSFTMPVLFLEGMRGKDYARRSAVLGADQSAGYALTFICFLFEGVAAMSVLLLIQFMVPEPLLPFGIYGLLAQADGLAALLPNLIAFAAMSLVAPFYIAGGFLLYLNRRTLLEAWDIELKFKAMALRKTAGARFLSLLFCFFWLLSAGLVFSTPAQAVPPAASIDKETAEQRIEQVLESDDFGREETRTYWRLQSFEQSSGAESRFLEDFFTRLIRFVVLMAEPVAWTAGGILFVFFLYTVARYFGFSKQTARKAPFKPPEALFGLSLTPASMPRDIAGHAEKHMAAGDMRAALSLLYRGALSSLVYRSFLEIPGSATEGECRALVQKSRPDEEFRFFRELTETWLQMAYGHVKPERQQVEALCRRWSEYYA